MSDPTENLQADSKRLRERIRKFYRWLNEQNWEKCFDFLDPTLKDADRIGFDAYSGSLSAFFSAIGPLEEVSVSDVQLHSNVASKLYGNRDFAHGLVVVKGRDQRPHTLHERWVKGDDGRWYTRRMGLLFHQPAGTEEAAVSGPDDIRAIPALIGQLYQTVQALNRIYPDRPFTPDGHLVGSIGEVVAADTYGLILEKCSKEGFDAKTKAGQTVQIKLTGRDSVALASDADPPDLLVVLKLDAGKGFTEIYNGEFPLDLWSRKATSKRRTRSLSLNQLKKLNPTWRLEQVHPLEELNQLFGQTGVL